MNFCNDDAIKLDYINGLLSEKERIHFEEHLATCSGCRQEIAELRETVDAVKGMASPSVPAAWTATAKDRLRAKRTSPSAAIPAFPAIPAVLTPVRRRTNLFQYALISATVFAAVGFLSWLVLGGAVQSWLPGLSTAALGISEPRAARIVDLVALILSLHALMFVPSIIDNIYQLMQKGSRKTQAGSSAGLLVC